MRLYRIGSEKIKNFDKNFDQLCDNYKKKAMDSGYHGDLKFIKEHNKIIIYVEIDIKSD